MMAEGMQVQTDKEGWVQGVQSREGDVRSAEDEQRLAAAEASRLARDVFRDLRTNGWERDNLGDALKVLAATGTAMGSFTRLKQAENGAVRAAHALARDFLETPQERVDYMRLAQPSHPGVRALPVPKNGK